MGTTRILDGKMQALLILFLVINKMSYETDAHN